jgi:AAA domain/Bifunctional DNA primase/polymerase, N-terminal
VHEFFRLSPDCNIAFCPDDMGLAVIDLDSGSDARPLGLPATRSVRTPRGGLHRHFIGSVRPTVGALGDHIDTRGRRSYALLPPSRTGEGIYAWDNDLPAVALPLEIEARLAARHDPAASIAGERDLPANVERARAYLRACVGRGDVAIAAGYSGGGGGDNLAYQVSAVVVRDCGLSEQTAIDLLLEEWYPHCTPNDIPEFIIEKVQNAARYGQNESGAHAVSSAPFPDLPELRDDQTPNSANRFKFLNPAEMSALRYPAWIIRDIIPEGALVLLTANQSSFKSFISLDTCLGLSVGKPVAIGQTMARGLCFYGAHEGLTSLQKLHRLAWCQYHGVDPNLDCGFYMGPAPFLGQAGDFQAFGEAIAAKAAGRPVKLIVIDTYSAAMMGADENDPSDANRFVFQCRELIAGFPGSSILVPAHFGKDRSRGTRGTSALEAGFDTLLTLEREERSRFVKLRVAKHRAAPEMDKPIWLEGRPVAGSLVFLPVDRTLITAAREQANPLHPSNVGRTLISLGAIDEDHAVTTDILAGAIRPQFENEHQARYEAESKKVARELAVLSRSSLHSLAFGEGQARKWCHAPSFPPVD